MTEELLLRLCEELGISPLSEQEDTGCFSLEISDEITVLVKDAAPGFSLRGNICLLPEKSKEALLEFCMEGNFLGQGTGKGIIGVDDEEKYLVLSEHITKDVEYPDFKAIIEDFVNYLSYWQSEAKTKNEATKEGVV